MDNTLFVGLSRQMTLRRQLDIAANNIANADTAGFKVESLMLQTDPTAGGLGGKRGSMSPVKFVLDNGIARDFRQGGLEQTSNTYDLALDGDGFFNIQTANGPRYTRDGRFTVDNQNRLVTKAGDPVTDAGGSTITLDPTASPPSISKDGVVSQTDSHGAVSQVGRLSAVRFANRSQLQKTGDNLYTTPETPLPAKDVGIRQGMVERSNVQPIVEISNLIEVTRTYEQVSNFISSTSDLSKSAIERLGRAA